MPQHNITLESPWKRIRLVPPSAADDEDYASCRTHPTSRRYLGFLPDQMTAEEARIRRESRAEDPHVVDFNIHYQEKDGNWRFAGFCCYFDFRLEYEMSCEGGIIVSPDLHGKNIATEAFYVLLQHIFEARNMHRVTFETSAKNVGMTRWFERVAGARLEAIRKEVWRLPGGSYDDVKGYAILDWEWRDRVKAKLEDRLSSTTIIFDLKGSPSTYTDALYVK